MREHVDAGQKRNLRHKVRGWRKRTTYRSHRAATARGGVIFERITGDDAELQAYLQRMAGYVLTGSTREQVLFFCYGTGPEAAARGVFSAAIGALLRVTLRTVRERRHREKPVELRRQRLDECGELLVHSLRVPAVATEHVAYGENPRLAVSSVGFAISSLLTPLGMTPQQFIDKWSRAERPGARRRRSTSSISAAYSVSPPPVTPTELGGRRQYAAAEALAAGHGGICAVSQITGVARSTIGRGLVELRDGATAEPDRVRRHGGGRKPLIVKDATLIDNLRSLVEPSTRGDPQASLLWTAKSLRNLAAGLRELGHQISHSAVGDLLRSLGYSLQANRKTREGGNHPDRDAQFGYINDQVKAALAAGEPAISVDTKKKELVGDFKNAGREWRPIRIIKDIAAGSVLLSAAGAVVVGLLLLANYYWN